MQETIEPEITVYPNGNHKLTCLKCSSEMNEGELCHECKKIIDFVCPECGFTTFDDMHELCFCQEKIIAEIFYPYK